MMKISHSNVILVHHTLDRDVFDREFYSRSLELLCYGSGTVRLKFTRRYQGLPEGLPVATRGYHGLPGATRGYQGLP